MSMYEEGKKAHEGFIKSRQFAGFPRDMRPEDAIKLFLPNVKETDMQIVTPLPKDRQEWLNGWNDVST